jgi:uncharacterized SAM-binding protein YcdF (DUF218 family)
MMDNDQKQITEAVNRIARFLARRDISALTGEALRERIGQDRVDLLILLGNAIPGTAVLAAEAYKKGLARRILVSGGRGHSTPYLIENIQKTQYSGLLAGVNIQTTPEAPLLTRILCDNGVPDAAVMIEAESVHCGDNAVKSLHAVGQAGMVVDTVLLIQDPTMQRRSHAAFEKVWPQGVFISYAPFVPEAVCENGRWEVRVPDGMRPAWEWGRFIDLILGEIPRLRDDARGYGPLGRDFIVHVDIPPEVESGAEWLSRRFNGARRIQK